MIFALLFSLPPSRNSDPGSPSSLFYPLHATVRALYLLSRGDFSPFFPRRLPSNYIMPLRWVVAWSAFDFSPQRFATLLLILIGLCWARQSPLLACLVRGADREDVRGLRKAEGARIGKDGLHHEEPSPPFDRHRGNLQPAINTKYIILILSIVYEYQVLILKPLIQFVQFIQ